MNKFLIILALISLCISGILFTGWGEQKIWNQKVTIEVETPNGIISNSTILTFVQSNYPKRLNSKKKSTLGLYGEAPSIEAKSDKHVFSLSLYNLYAIITEYAAHYDVSKDETDFIIDRLLNDTTRPEIVSFTKPSFFYFRDQQDAKSIKQISYSTFDWAFGHGTKLKSIKYQVTDEPRTSGKIRSILPWLDGHRGPFVPNFKTLNSQEPNIPSFNRSILSRHYNCTIDAFMMNNLTYGFYHKGINCKF